MGREISLALYFLAIAMVTMTSVSLIVTSADSSETKKSAKPNITSLGITPSECRKTMMIVAKRQIKVFVSCSKELHVQYPEKEDFKKHFQCIIRCALVKENALDENMMMTQTTIDRFYEQNIPEKYVQVGHFVMDDCVAEWGPKLDPKDPTCVAYGNFIKCMQENAGDLCSDKTESET